MGKTLVIVLSETRAHELTYTNFEKNVLHELRADLCICIGVSPNYDYENPFYKKAKYRFLYDEPSDFGDAFEEAYQEILSNHGPFLEQPLYWREFLKIKDQFLGGIKDEKEAHPGSAGILIFFRWFLAKKIRQFSLHTVYERFVITRSDYLYQLPHPQMDILNPEYIWIPDEEHYGGFTDRHVILSKSNLFVYLSILENMVLKSHQYFSLMQHKHDWNLEQVIKFHLIQENTCQMVRHFPYIMYSVRNKNGTTRWSQGVYVEVFGYYIKYTSEYIKSYDYLDEFKHSNQSLTEFYKSKIGN